MSGRTKKISLTQYVIYGTSSAKEITEMYRDNIRRCRSKADVYAVAIEYLPYIWYERAAKTTVSKYYDLMNVSKELGRKGEWALEVLQPPKNFLVAINKQDHVQVVNNLQKRKEVDMVFFEEMFQLITEKLEHKDFYEEAYNNQTPELIEAYYKFVFLTMATGRRPVELLKTMSVTKHGKKITFHGLVKKRELEDAVLEHATIIFTDYKTVKKYLSELRAFFVDAKDMSHKDINNSYSGKTNAFLKKLFDDDSLSFKTIRAMYAAIAFEQSDKKLPEDKFFQRVLGHKEAKTAADHYRKYIAKQREDIKKMRG